MSNLPFSLSIAIHAHAPYVPATARRQAESTLSDAWFAFVAETMLPLLNTLQRLRENDIEAPIAVGISPIVCEMLGDLHLPVAFEKYLHRHIERSRAHERELAARGQTVLAQNALFWENWYQTAERDFEEKFNSDLLGALRSLHDAGTIELFTTPATEAFLPYLSRESAINAQLAVAVENFKKHFGSRPRGIWLPSDWRRPNDGPVPRLARLLKENGFEYAVAGAPTTRDDSATRYFCAQSPLLRALLEHDAHALPQQKVGVTMCDAIAVVQPHAALSEQVWSRAGYAGDARFLHGERRVEPGGLRLWRITHEDTSVDLSPARCEPYDAMGNMAICEAQAAHWLERAGAWANEANGPLCAAFEAAFFGRHWFEGPQWLFRVLKRASGDENINLQFVSQSSTLENLLGSEGDALEPLDEGAEVDVSLWLNPQTEWLWPEIADCEARLDELARAHAQTQNPKLREVLNQAARELLLIQSGDWPHALSLGAGLHRESSQHGANRFAEHLDAFECLCSMARTVASGEFLGEGQRAYLDALCDADNIFSEIDFALWAKI